MGKCGYCGRDGFCNNPKLLHFQANRTKCERVKRCPGSISEKEYEKKVNKNAHTRQFTRDTKYFIVKWYRDGYSVVEIADILSRTTTTVRRILRNEGLIND